MRAGKLLLLSIILAAVLTASSLAAIKTVTYSSQLPENLVNWNGNHNLPKFDPAMGNLISIDFTATLNASLDGKAENTNPNSGVQDCYMQDLTDMYVTMLDSSLLPLNVTLRYPSDGTNVSVTAFDGTLDFLGTSAFSGNDSGSTQDSIFYSLPAQMTPYIGTGTFNLLTVTTASSTVIGGGNFASFISTKAWSNATITYTYNDELCLSGYKKDGCTGLPLSGWNITVRNSSWQQNETTNSSGFWEVCNLTPGSYWVNETAKSGWMNTTPASQSLLLGNLNRTVNFFNIPVSNFTISKTATPENPDPGEMVTFTINVTNIGVASLSSVRVMDVLPVEMTYISSNPPGTLNDNIIVWENVGPIGPFSSTYLQVLMRSAE